MLYYKSCGFKYQDFINYNDNTKYGEFILIPYSDIISVNVVVNDNIEIKAKTTAENVLGNAILGGGTGAIIGAGNSPTNTQYEQTTKIKSVELRIRTWNDNYKTIEFEFSRIRDVDNLSRATNGCYDIFEGTFSDNPFTLSQYVSPTNKTSYIYERHSKKDEETKLGKYTSWYSLPNSFFDNIIDSMTDCQERVNDLIQRNKAGNGSVNIPDTADRLKKLKGLLDEGLITEQEYNEKRSGILAEV